MEVVLIHAVVNEAKELLANLIKHCQKHVDNNALLIQIQALDIWLVVERIADLAHDIRIGIGVDKVGALKIKKQMKSETIEH